MEENNEKNFNINNPNAKKESVQTDSDVKRTKDIKKFFEDFFKNPINQLQKVSSDTKNKFLKAAIIILTIWLVAILLYSIFDIAETYLFGYLGNFNYFFKHLFINIFSTIKKLLTPLFSILILSGLIYTFQKKNNNSFFTIILTVLVAKIPIVIATVFSLLSIIDSQISKLNSAFSSYCNIISTVLLYFAVMYLLPDEKESNTVFWKFALIMGLFYIVKFIFSFLATSISLK